jgi:transposase-like protein
MEALLREYETSGLTQAEFARRAGVKYSTFAGWVHARRAQPGGREGGASTVHFARVQLPAASVAPAELSAILPDGVIVRGTDAAGMAALVRALRREPC